MPVITCIEDLKVLHRRRTPRMFYDYCESGSYSERTFRDNSTDFDQIRLRQRIAVDLSDRSTQSEMLGEKVAVPLALAPVGMLGMQRADGEIKAAKAALKKGVPFTLSTMSICSIEDVAEATGAPFWFQLYVMRDEEFVDAILARAKAAGCSALVLTVDLQLLGQRHRDLKNALTAPPKPTVANAVDFANPMRWPWIAEMLGTERRTFRNIVGHAKSVADISSLHSWTAEQFDPKLDWDKIARIRDKWGGKLILKGVLEEEDAVRCADLGADALVVSNHGGRQLDGALSSIRRLAPIVREVGERIEVWLDSGIRSGQDILKALALGAKGTMVGRSYVYGLGALGQEGVEIAIETLRKELDVTMALCGERDVKNVGPHNILVPEDFEGRWRQ